MASIGGLIRMLRDAWEKRQELARANQLIDIKVALEIEKATEPLTELKKQATLEEVRYLEAQGGIAHSKSAGGAGNEHNTEGPLD